MANYIDVNNARAISYNDTAEVKKVELILSGCERKHTAYCRGYVRANSFKISAYNGMYGKGYRVFNHNSKSSNYCFVTYYIGKKEE